MHSVARRPRKVLIADDDSDTREILEMMFQAERHDVLVAKDGNDALRLAERCLPDVIVTDLQLPGAKWTVPWKTSSFEFEI